MLVEDVRCLRAIQEAVLSGFYGFRYVVEMMLEQAQTEGACDRQVLTHHTLDMHTCRLTRRSRSSIALHLSHLFSIREYVVL